MTGAMYAAIGGLKTHMSNLNVIGNNIANVNTQTYKAQRMTFQESIYVTSRAGSNGTVSTGGNNPSQVGYGAQVGSIDLNMSPGTYSPTGYDLDCMIGGEGFFMVGDKNTGDSIDSAADLSTFDLSRMGDFWVDANGYVCDRRGKCLYGFAMVQNPAYDPIRNPEEPETIVSTRLVPLRVPLAAAEPIGGQSGWQAGDPVYDILTSADPRNNNARGNFEIGPFLEKVYDTVRSAVGSNPDLADEEEITVCYPTTGGAGGGGGNNVISISDADMRMLGLPETLDYSVTLKMSKGSIVGISGMRLPVGYGERNENSLGLTGGGQGNQQQQGIDYVSGDVIRPIPNGQNKPIKLTGMAIGKDGAIVGTSENGQAVTIGYAAIVNAAANDGVSHIDGYYYKALEGAGDLTVSVPGNVLGGRYLNNKFAGENTANAGGNAGDAEFAETNPPIDDLIGGGGDTEIRNGGLEASTADVATEFANMILTQRGYQANTRMVTVTDSMLEELVNMKR